MTQNKEKNFISIVMNIRNAERFIEDNFCNIIELIDNNFIQYEFVIINNASHDSGIEKIKNIISNYNSENIVLNIINVCEYISYEDAVAIGTEFAIGDFMLEIDISHIDYNLELIIEGYKTLLTDIDVVFISPNRKNSIFQLLYYKLYNFGVCVDKYIYPTSCRLVSRRAVNRANQMGGGHNLSTPLYKNCGLKNKNIFYTPLKYKFHYTSVELKERLSKAWETIVVYTDTIPKLLFYLIVFTVALNLIAIMFGEKFFSAILFIAILLFSNTLILIQFLIKLYRSSDENTKQKISSIDKVIK